MAAELRPVIAQASTWAELYHALFNCEVFLAEYDLQGRLFDREALDVLRLMVEAPERYRRLGEIDEVTPGGVRGWSVDPAEPDRPGAVELWLDGDFVAAAPVDRFRRDLQDRFGGAGNIGFFIEYPGGWPTGRPYRLELKDQASGRLLQRLDREGEAQRPDLASGLKTDLATARRLLNSIEQRLRDEERRSATKRERYDLYYDQVYRGALGLPAAGTRHAPACILVDVAGASHLQLDLALRQVGEQATARGDTVAVLNATAEQQAWVQEIDTRLAWAGHSRLKPQGDSLFAESLAQVVAPLAGDQVVLFAPATGFVADQGLDALVAGFTDSRVKAVFADDDALETGEGMAASATHVAPRLKPAFDPDLFVQTPYLGDFMAVRAELLHQGEPDALAGFLAGALTPQAAVLGGALSSDQVAHVGRVLFTRFWQEETPDPAPAWAALVQATLGEASDLKVEPFDDILGVDLKGAVRIAPRAEGTAAIIIPTRNGLDLLKPCVESIRRSLAHNRVEAEIIIINHESDDPATLAYIEAQKAQADTSVIDYEGTFNWALMNNLAAGQTQADVLVFLNNDTLIISEDWLDRLCGQARRPEVGVVGARLLYQNGCIQHAGFVWRDGNPGFLIHDGVGALGRDGGYLGRHALTHACVAVTGACMAVASETFRALGGFDAAHFPVEGNDVDLCLRAWDRGLRVLYEPGATLYHLESISRGFSREGEKLKIAQRANAVLTERWGHEGRVDPWFNTHFSREGTPFEKLRPPR
ncbi:glycosyltransferase [Brevundimonas vesicularis]|uniref:glycosyltransferase n=1 Tax=Brevundimonas vesicularis TaxID=41276 RepID=UPI0038D4C62C